jgi:hypothetical protein
VNPSTITKLFAIMVKEERQSGHGETDVSWRIGQHHDGRWLVFQNKADAVSYIAAALLPPDTWLLEFSPLTHEDTLGLVKDMRGLFDVPVLRRWA